MNQQNTKILEQDLQAFVDGQLDEEQHAKIADYLNQNPEEAKRVAAYRQQNDLMHGLFDPILDEPIPESLREPLQTKPAATWRIAATMSWIALGTVFGWFLHATTTVQTSDYAHQQIISPAMSAHVVYTPEVKHPVEVDSSNEAHLVKWLSKRLQHKVNAPKLSGHGYELVGGRLLANDSDPAALFMYQNQSGERITLFIRSQLGQNFGTAFRYHKQQDFSMFYWIDGSTGYAITGHIDKDSLLNIAHSVYQQLTL